VAASRTTQCDGPQIVHPWSIHSPLWN